MTESRGGRRLAVFVAAEHETTVDLDQVKAQAELVLGEELEVARDGLVHMFVSP